MKLVKMSLAAAVLLGASAFAIDNVKVSGDAKLYYGTNNMDNATGGDLFDKDNSYADTALRLGVTGDLLKGVSFGMTANAVSTLGLENNLVSNTWTGAHTASNGVDDAAWVSELWLATTMGKTTAKVGRMELDTPLAFSEKWSIATNTFDAAVLINQDLPDTTLVGAWVGKGNGVNALGNAESIVDGVLGTDPLDPNEFDGALGGYNNSGAVGIDGVLGGSAKFSTFMSKGAYAVGIVNNSIKPLVAQAWYYNVGNVADAYWLQADINCQLVPGVKIGAQYAHMAPKDTLENNVKAANAALPADDSSAYAVQLAYEGVKNLKLSAAYSDVDEDGLLNIANTATKHFQGGQSKLFTEAAWGGNFGYVGVAGAESMNLKAQYDAGFAKFCASYTDVEIDKNINATSAALNGKAGGTDMNEIALSASKSFGPLDTRLQYVSTDADDKNDAKRFDTLNVYVTLNF